MLTGKPPFCDTIKSFGCLCYASTLAHNRGKFEPRTNSCVFLGYAHNQKGYKLLELSGKKMFVSRDVVFYEDKFPFATSSISSDSPFFPTHTSHSEMPAPDNQAPNPFSIQVPASPSPSHIHSSSPKHTHTHNQSSSLSHVSFKSPILDNSHNTDAHLMSNSDMHSPHFYRTPIPLTSMPGTPILVLPPPIRKSDRISQKPVYLNDYIYGSIVLSDLTSSCFSQSLTPNVFSFGELSLQNQYVL